MLDSRKPSSQSFGPAVLSVAAIACVLGAMPAAAQEQPGRQVTYSKDIAPILQRSCQHCHRPDSIAPMSLLTYEQVRPWVRSIKARTGLRNAPGSRGVMPPWFIEKNIGVQQFKEDISLSDEEIALIAKWADSGAPQGDPADLPPPLKFADAATWQLGKPDLLVSSPKTLVKGVGSDWWGPVGETPTGMTETRYARAVEVKESSDLDVKEKLRSNAGGATYAGQGKTALVVFHHANINVATASGQEFGDGEGGGGLTLHEVGRGTDIFLPEAGKIVPSGSALTFNAHLHSPGVPGADRNAWLDVGLYFHPKGYTPKYREGQIQMASTELIIRPDSDNQRYDAYWVAPTPVKLVNFEPHLHATGIRMCMEAIYERAIETLNCSGYDHNWVKNYQYTDESAPLLPKGTILHVIAWFDGTGKNPNNIEPRNATVWGRRSVANMFGVENRAIYLTDDQYLEELAKRKEHLKLTNSTPIGCPGCFDTSGRGVNAARNAVAER